MSRSIIQTSVPSTEIVQPSDMYTFLDGYPGTEDAFLTTLIQASRDYVEGKTGYCLAPRTFIEYLDRFPMFDFAPSSFGPLFGVAAPFFMNGPISSYPTGFENKRNPFEIELGRNPVQAVDHIEYTDLQGNVKELYPGTDFVADLTSEPARVAPLAKTLWPVALGQPKAVAIFYTAGYFPTFDAETQETPPRVLGYPPILKLVIMQLAVHWYIKRDVGPVPVAIDDVIFANRVVDYNPDIE